jgi:hypothetical protein
MPANGLYRFVGHVIKGRRTLPIAAPVPQISTASASRFRSQSANSRSCDIELDISIVFFHGVNLG